MGNEMKKTTARLGEGLSRKGGFRSDSRGGAP